MRGAAGAGITRASPELARVVLRSGSSAMGSVDRERVMSSRSDRAQRSTGPQQPIQANSLRRACPAVRGWRIERSLEPSGSAQVDPRSANHFITKSLRQADRQR